MKAQKIEVKTLSPAQKRVFEDAARPTYAEFRKTHGKRAAALIERHMAEFDAQIRAAVSRRIAAPLTA